MDPNENDETDGVVHTAEWIRLIRLAKFARICTRCGEKGTHVSNECWSLVHTETGEELSFEEETK